MGKGESDMGLFRIIIVQDGGTLRDCGEGPWESYEAAEEFQKSEVGMPSVISGEGESDMTMREMADRVIRQMSRAEKSETLRGNLEPATWVAGKVLGVNEDQAARVAEKIADVLSGG